jgi:glycosyltransferase involved in cell wall biosynthesis
MPNFNHARFLPAALDAIFSQSRLPDEMFVIDDASTDNSVEILRKYTAQYPGLRLILCDTNQGATASLTQLVSMARGSYFYAPAADDVIRPGFLEKSLQILAQHPEAGLCSTLSEILDEDGNPQGLLDENPFGRDCRARFVSPRAALAQLYRRGSWMHGNTVIFRRQALIDAGGYRAALGPYADGFVHEVIALTHGACFIPEPLAAWRRMPASLSAQTSLNPVAVRRVRDAARACMAGEHREVFTPAYVRRWARRWDAGALVAYSRAKRNEWQAGLATLFPTEGVLDGALKCAAGAAVNVSYAVMLAGAAVLRWFDLGQYAVKRVRRWVSGPTRP